ncbi:SRPBCC family protein [Cumulibacter soli]|uniref:SRPBCC family protein n=1 Tax=Cumulibacter soli TaxID=2546344 RepID=UPI00106744C7|nr:SRPBCC family protein [Cumulibacter soli]
MELEHSFTIPVPVEKAWPVLLDVEQIAPCMPGASVDNVDGDDFTGSVKVKLGPINLTYKGQASFVEKDEANHRAVIDARGRDARGNGTAAAKVTATLSGQGDSTEVKVVTDLNITGKPAQFGRGVMVDVGNKLIGQFADCLASKLAGDSDSEPAEPAADAAASAAADKASGEGATTTASGDEDKTPTGSVPAVSAATADADKAKAAQASAPKPAPAREAEPIDLIELAGGSVAKKAAPIAIGGIVLFLLLFLLRGRGKKSDS